MALDTATSLTFDDLILEVAEEWRLAAHPSSGAAGIPTDTHDLDLVQRKVNKGYDRFLRDDPNWSFMLVIVTITIGSTATFNTIDGDTARYRLPRYITGQPRSNWWFTNTDIRYGEIIPMHHAVLEQMRQGSPSSGRPRYAAVRPLETKDDKSGQIRGWELLLYPDPEQTYVIAADFRIRSDTLLNPLDRHIAGRDHDRTIIAASNLEMAMQDAEGRELLSRYETDYLACLGSSRRLDLKARPSRLGQVTDVHPSGLTVTTHSNLGTLSINGVAVKD